MKTKLGDVGLLLTIFGWALIALLLSISFSTHPVMQGIPIASSFHDFEREIMVASNWFFGLFLGVPIALFSFIGMKKEPPFSKYLAPLVGVLAMCSFVLLGEYAILLLSGLPTLIKWEQARYKPND